jgi:hypothetical protein
MADIQKVEIVNKRPNHILHLLLSLVTFGLWIPVWIALTGSANLRQVNWNSNDGWSRILLAIIVGVAIYYALR